MLKHGALVGNIAHDLRRKDKETAIDPSSLPFGLFPECTDGRSNDAQAAEASRGLHGRYRHQFAVAPVKSDRRGDIKIAHSVSIGHAKGVFSLQIWRDLS